MVENLSEVPSTRQVLDLDHRLSTKISNSESLLSLEAALVELEQLFSSHNILHLHYWDITLLRNVFREVKAWSDDQQSRMTCSAQVAFAHSAIKSYPTGYVDWSKPPCETSLVMYLHLMRLACASGLFDEDVTYTLRTAIQDSQESLNTSQLHSCADQLDILHVLADLYVGYYSITDAIKYIKTSLNTAQPYSRARNINDKVKMSSVLAKSSRLEDLNCAIQIYLEGLEVTNDRGRGAFLVLLGTTLARRFDQTRDMNDLDRAVERVQAAVDLTSITDSDYPRRQQCLRTIMEARHRIQKNTHWSTELTNLGMTTPLPPLKILLSQLGELLSLDDALSLLLNDRVLISNVYHEIETWIIDKPPTMTWDAQIALAHSAVVPRAAEYVDWNKTPPEISVMMYLHLMQRASDSGLFDDDMQETLHTAIQDTEEWIVSSRDSRSDVAYIEQLATMQAIGDCSVACCSIVDAIKHVRDSLGAVYPSHRTSNMKDQVRLAISRLGSPEVAGLNQSIQTLVECLMCTEGEGRLATIALLAPVLCSRFVQFGQKKDIDTAILQFEEAIRMTSIEDDNRAIYLFGLARALATRFERFSEINDNSLAIDRFQEALSLTSVGNGNYLAGVQDLAFSLQCRFMLLRQGEDINKAIELWQEAINLLPVGSARRAHCFTQLGIGFRCRFNLLDSVDDLDSTIRCLQEAYNCTPSNPHAICDLVTAFQIRFERSGKVEDLESSISHGQQAVKFDPSVSSMTNLAHALIRQFEWFGRVEDLESAIIHCRRAVELDPSASSLSTLAHTFLCRFQRFGRVEDLDLAIEADLKAVDSASQDDHSFASYLSRLGAKFRIRYFRLKEDSDLEKAFAYQQQYLDLTPLDDPDRPAGLMSLGNCFANRYDQHQDLKDINRAIELLQTASQTCHPDSPYRYKVLHNLGQHHISRFNRLGDLQDLEMAIESQSEAVVLRQDEPSVHDILSRFLSERYFNSKQRADLDLAIRHSHTAVNLTPVDHPDRSEYLRGLGRMQAICFLDHADDDSYAHAISAFQSSCKSVSGEPRWRLLAAWDWAYYARKQNDLESAAEAYRQAIHLLPSVVWFGLGAAAQLANVSDSNGVDVQSLACDAAACILSLAEAKPTQRQYYLAQAVELLDQGRSILWSQASQLRHDLADLRQVDPDLAEELDQVGQFLSIRGFDSQDHSEANARAYRASAQRWEELVSCVRKLPGLESFLLPLPISKLREAAKDGPIIIVNFSKFRCDTLIMPYSGDIVLVPLTGKAMHHVKDAADEAFQSAPHRDQILRTGRPVISSNDPLQNTLHKSWMWLGEPVVRQLESMDLPRSGISHKPHVWWCLTGSLTFLPIHAAYPPCAKSGEQPLGMMDLVISSYTPTVATLLRSQQRQLHNSSHVQMLAVGQSQDLPMVKEELDVISQLVPQDQLTVLRDNDATADTTSHRLMDCTWAHFACHGIQDHLNPLDSGLKMYDKLLTLCDLARIRLPSANFVFLSCCQSATGSLKYTEESLHIAAGFQFVGFCSVIGTLWSVGDVEAKLIAEHIYTGLFKNGVTNPNFAEAGVMLNHAVRYLRDICKVPLQRWVPFVHFGL